MNKQLYEIFQIFTLQYSLRCFPQITKLGYLLQPVTFKLVNYKMAELIFV